MKTMYLFKNIEETFSLMEIEKGVTFVVETFEKTTPIAKVNEFAKECGCTKLVLYI